MRVFAVAAAVLMAALHQASGIRKEPRFAKSGANVDSGITDHSAMAELEGGEKDAKLQADETIPGLIADPIDGIVDKGAPDDAALMAEGSVPQEEEEAEEQEQEKEREQLLGEDMLEDAGSLAESNATFLGSCFAWCSRAVKPWSKKCHWGSCRGCSQCWTECGKLGEGPEVRIVNGDDAGSCKWRWQVGLRSYSGGQIGCGGMLISPEWVLTAAHCLVGPWSYEFVGQDGIFVVAGQTAMYGSDATSQERKSIRTFIHPDYNTGVTANNDIGLIKLESPMDMTGCVGTVCLPTEDVSPSKTCWVTGWGTLYRNGPSANTLQEAQVQVLSNEACKNTGYRRRHISSKMLCAQGRKDDKVVDTCQGDSGGPLVCESGGKWNVYGATSFGEGCAMSNYPGVYARVASSDISDWIKATME